MTQLLKLELLSMLLGTARRMRENAANPSGSSSVPMLDIATQLEQEARDLEAAALSEGVLARPWRSSKPAIPALDNSCTDWRSPNLPDAPERLAVKSQ